MARLSWVTCDGGPHLLIAEEWAGLWEGSCPPSRGRVVNAQFRWNGESDAAATDYDAACDIADLVGVISVGEGVALVLGDEVPMSTWVESPLFAGGLLVVPMTWSEPGMPENRLLAAVNSVERSAFTHTGLTLPSSSGRFILCAASDAGPDWVYPVAHITVPGVAYQILSAEVRTQGFWLRLQALHPTS
jgi:hypothetical protein